MHDKPNFLEKLQNLDEATKQKIMIAATIIMMIVVIWIWLAYFNPIVVSGAVKS